MPVPACRPVMTTGFAEAFSIVATPLSESVDQLTEAIGHIEGNLALVPRAVREACAETSRSTSLGSITTPVAEGSVLAELLTFAM